MPSRTIPRRALVLTAAALAVLPATALTAPARAAAAPPAATAATATTATTATTGSTGRTATASGPAAAAPVRFVDLPNSALPTDRAPHQITFRYRNDTPKDQTVAPQILVESPQRGPFLSPSDIRLELRGTDGSWHTVPLASQTGTLYTALIPAKIVLHSGHTLTESYRITVLHSPARGTVEPRIAVYA
ncbi:signal peptide protein [Kitasatospora sp. NPDC028055]|uniref:signal peptide protein n=1 Tax=Kitasatospora sp. NPDC028055 TaxID=3155653 RepID=UPI0033DF2C3E